MKQQQPYFSFAFCGSQFNGVLVIVEYTAGGMGVQILSESDESPGDVEVFTSISCHFPESLALPKEQFYCKHWSEHEGLIEQLEDLGLLERMPGPLSPMGGPPYRLTEKARTHFYQGDIFVSEETE